MTQPVKTLHQDKYPAIDPEGALKESCSGKLICILGASQGCGQAMAVSYAQAGAAQLFLTARAVASLEETKEAVQAANSTIQVHVYSLDLKQPDLTQETMQTILKDAGGKLDVLVTNAGVLEQWRPIAESEPEEWWSSFEINIRGSYLAARAAIRSWLQGDRGGTIILVTSAGSLRTRPGASAYQTTKLAINRLAQFIHADHGKQGIRAFALHPGGVPTKLALGMPEDMYTILNDTPWLSGAACVYLASSRADFLRGRYVSSQWDVEELEARQEEILEKDLLKVQLTI